MQADQLVVFQSRMRELQASLSEAESQLLPAQYSLEKMKREQASQNEHVRWLEQELSTKSTQLTDLRRETSEKNEELTSQLQLARCECQSRAEDIKKLQDETTLREEKVLELAEQVRNLEKQCAEQRESFLAELEASKRMADLYKRHFDEATTKMRELEESNSMWQQRLIHNQQKAREELTLQVERAQEVLKESEDAAKKQISELEEELDEAKRHLQDMQHQQGPIFKPASNDRSSDSLVVQDKLAEPLGLSAADMLDKMIAAEKVAAEETRKRKECELYLEKILKDIETKAPMIASQRRDYKRVLESHGKLSKRVDDLVTLCNSQKAKLAEEEKLRISAVLESSSLEIQNKDLARQLQHVLKKSVGISTGKDLEIKDDATSLYRDAGGVISDHLVTFDNVEELQMRNMQLLRVVRKLSTEQEQQELVYSCGGIAESSMDCHVILADGVKEGTQSANSIGDMEEALKAAVSELSNMRESRQRMEEMVENLVQQRDIYRAMLEEVDADNSVRSKHVDWTVKSPIASPPAPLHTGDSGHNELEKARHEIQGYKEETRKLKERITLLEHAEQVLSDAVDKEREEITILRSKLAAATSDAKFQGHRVSSLEGMLEASKRSEDSLSRRRMEAEGLLIAQQVETRKQSDALIQMRESLRLAEEKIRQGEIRAEVGSASEARMQAQIQELRDEIVKQGELSESMSRIEATLVSRQTLEREQLERDVQTLTDLAERRRKELNETVLIGEQKTQTLEDELRLCRAEKDRKAEEVSTLREELARLQGTCSAAQERSGVLERQLTILQDRLAATQGANVSDSLLAAENDQKDTELERLYRELEELKMQLRASETHVAQFRTISNSTDLMLKELQKRSDEKKEALEEELANCLKELGSVRKELVERKDQVVNAMNEAENLRESLSRSTKQFEEELKSSSLANETAACARIQAEKQLETLRNDLMLREEAVKEATANYERELALHAKAAADLRAVESRLEVTQRDLELSRRKTAELSAKCLELELRCQEQENKAAKDMNSLKDDIAAHKRTNDLLHSQVQSMSVQLARHSEQSIRLDEPRFQVGEEEVNKSPDVTASADEIAELRKSSFELREVIRCMKREKDMTEARMTLAETEKHRYSAQLSSVQKSLDEARAELQREFAAKSNPARSDADFTKLMSEITELNVVRESNAHLRSEYEHVSKERDKLMQKLQSALAEAAPVKDQVSRLEGEIEVLQAEKSSLTADVGYWKDRMHQLVSRYSDVDPEEHRLLQEQLAETKKELASNKELLEQCTKDGEAAKQELALVKNTVQRLEKTNENFRGKLRQLTSDKKVVEQQNAKLRASLSKAKAAVTDQKTQKSEAVKQTSSASVPPTLDTVDKKQVTEKSPLSKPVAQVAPKTATQLKGVDKGDGIITTNSAPPLPPSSTTLDSISENRKRQEDLRKRLLAKKEAKATASLPNNSAIISNETVADVSGNANVEGKGLSQKRKIDDVTQTTTVSPSNETQGEVDVDPEAGNSKSKMLNSTEEQSQSGAPLAKRSHIECKYFHSSAGCKHGENCHYMHSAAAGREVAGSVTEASTKPSTTVPVSMNSTECNYFQAGSCRYGDNCRFVHTPATSIHDAQSNLDVESALLPPATSVAEGVPSEQKCEEEVFETNPEPQVVSNLSANTEKMSGAPEIETKDQIKVEEETQEHQQNDESSSGKNHTAKLEAGDSVVSDVNDAGQNLSSQMVNSGRDDTLSPIVSTDPVVSSAEIEEQDNKDETATVVQSISESQHESQKQDDTVLSTPEEEKGNVLEHREEGKSEIITDQVPPWPVKQQPAKKSLFSSGFVLGMKQVSAQGGFSFSTKASGKSMAIPTQSTNPSVSSNPTLSSSWKAVSSPASLPPNATSSAQIASSKQIPDNVSEGATSMAKVSFGPNILFA